MSRRESECSALEHDLKERDAVMGEIYAAFAGVTRGEEGYSWSECEAHDNWEPDAVCKAARRADRDKDWRELIDDPNWEPVPGIGGFTFINAEGFRYYLPATMIRFLRNDPHTESFPGELAGYIEQFTGARELSLWSEKQLRSIARFVAFVAAHDVELEGSYEPNRWVEALERRWKKYL